MKTYSARAVLACMATAGYLSTWMLAQSARGQDSAPEYTFDILVTQFRNGEPFQKDRETQAVRGNGSTVAVRSYSQADGSNYQTREIFDSIAMKRYVVHSLAQSVSTMAAHQQSAASSGVDSPRCGQPRSAPAEVLLGFDVVQIRSRGQIGGEVSVERWVAPQLGCATLKVTAFRDGKIFSVRQVERALMGSPDPSLFTIPAGYKEMSPRQILEVVRGRSGDSKAQPMDIFEIEMEQNYQRLHGPVR